MNNEQMRRKVHHIGGYDKHKENPIHNKEMTENKREGSPQSFLPSLCKPSERTSQTMLQIHTL
jgi:hypothetical protein